MNRSKIVLNIATVIIILAVTLMAGLLRLKAAVRLPIDYDEDDYLLAGQHYAGAIQTGNLKEIMDYSYNLEHPPLYKIIYGLVFSIFPASKEIAQRPVSAAPATSLPRPFLMTGRLTSVTFSTLEVLTLSILNPLAGLFLGIQTFTIKYGSQIYLEAFPALTSLLMVLAYNKSKGRINIWLILSSALLGMTAASKYIYTVAGIAVLIHWLTHKQDGGMKTWLKKTLPIILLWGVLALVFFTAFDPFLWVNPLARLKESISFNVNYSQSSQVTSSNLPFWQPLYWLAISVPWHRGVFVVGVDALITILAIPGIKRQWKKNSVYVIWLIVALIFLLIWPTHWPQYILILTAPLSLIAAEGFRALLVDPLCSWLRRIRKKQDAKTAE